MSTPTDAFNGSTEGVQTIRFTYRGVAYTIDLDAVNAAEFDTAVAPLIAAGRWVGGRPPPPS